jgi:hypothetical protein
VLRDDEDDDQATQVGPLKSIAKGKKRDQTGPEDHLGGDQQHPTQAHWSIVSEVVLKKL